MRVHTEMPMSGRDVAMVIKGLMVLAEALVERVKTAETAIEAGDVLAHLHDVVALADRLFRASHSEAEAPAPPKRKHRRKVTLDPTPAPASEPVN